MKKYLLEAICIIIGVLFMVLGIMNFVRNIPITPKCDRFETISREVYIGDTYIEFLYDKETKVKYIYIDGYRGDSITALIDADGKPLLYEGE